MSTAWEACGQLRETLVSHQVSSVMGPVHTVSQGFTGWQPGAQWPLLAECELSAVSSEKHTSAVLVELVGAAERGGPADTLSGGPRTPT